MARAYARPAVRSRRRHILLALGLVLVLQLAALPTTEAAWPQYRGGGDRGGSWDPADHELSVVDQQRRAADPDGTGFWLGGPATGGSHGSLALLVDQEVWGLDLKPGRCTLVAQTLPASGSVQPLDSDTAVRQYPVPGCQEGAIQAYSATDDLFLVCGEGTPDRPVLHAITSSGDVAWTSTAPALQGEAPVSGLDAVGDLAPGTTQQTTWTCAGGALDPAGETFYVAYHPRQRSQANQHAIAAHDVTSGALVWSTRITPADLVVDAPSSALPERADAHFYPHGITLTSTGLLVTGEQGCPQCDDTLQSAVAWLSLDGTANGILAARTTTTIGRAQDRLESPDVVSAYATAKGAIGVVVLGGQVVQVNPDASEPAAETPFRTLAPDAEGAFWPAGAWTRDTVILATDHGVSAYDETLQPRWTYTDLQSWQVEDLVASDQELWLLMVREGDDGQDAVRTKLTRIALEDGTAQAEYPLPFTDTGLVVRSDSTGSTGRTEIQAPWHAAIVPDGDQLFVVDAHGSIARIDARAPNLPTFRLIDAYPAVGDTAAVDLGPSLTALRDDPAFVGANLHWGDGESIALDIEATKTHRYDEAGDRMIRLVATYEDGTTRLLTQTIHVGGQAPPELTLIQQAFAPENYDLTFGILGIVIALMGGLFAVARSRVRKDRLDSYLRRLEAHVEEGRTDPAGAIEAIEVLRQEIRQKLSRGRLDDIQYGVLNDQTTDALTRLRNRLITPYETRLTPQFRRLFTRALADGIVTDKEAEHLLDALGRQKRLRTDEREQLAGFIETWARRATAGRRT